MVSAVFKAIWRFIADYLDIIDCFEIVRWFWSWCGDHAEECWCSCTRWGSYALSSRARAWHRRASGARSAARLRPLWRVTRAARAPGAGSAWTCQRMRVHTARSTRTTGATIASDGHGASLRVRAAAAGTSAASTAAAARTDSLETRASGACPWVRTLSLSLSLSEWINNCFIYVSQLK